MGTQMLHTSEVCCTPALGLVQVVLGYGSKKLALARAYRVHRKTYTQRAGSDHFPSVYHRSEHTTQQKFRIYPMAHPSWLRGFSGSIEARYSSTCCCRAPAVAAWCSRRSCRRAAALWRVASLRAASRCCR